MKNSLLTPVLVLNKHFVASHVTVAKNAFRLLYKGVAKAVKDNYQSYDFESWASLPVEHGDATVTTPSSSIKIPRVIILVSLDRPPRYEVRFSKKNVMLRDEHRCCYCGTDEAQLNLDHVMPVSRGGQTTWENVVTCCLSCNTKKANYLPGEIGMKLLKQPKKPTWHPARLTSWIRDADPSWNTYLIK